MPAHNLGARSATPGTRRPWPARHGSGALAPDPMDIGPTRRTQRSPSPGRHATQFQPAGPLTANEWSDQVEWLQRQLTTLSRTISDHAHLLGQLTSVTLPAADTKIDKLAGLIDQRITALEQRVNHGGSLVTARLDSLAAEIQRIMGHQSPAASRAPSPSPGVPPSATAEHFPLGTPPRHSDAHPGGFPIGGQAHVGVDPQSAPWGGMHHQSGNDFAGHDFGVNSSPSIGGSPVPNNNNGVNSHGVVGNSHGVAGNQFGTFGPSNAGPAFGNTGGGSGPHIHHGQCSNGAYHHRAANDAYHHHEYLPKWTQPPTTPMWNSFPNSEWRIGKKGIGELPVFDGNHEKYSHWKNKLSDFCAETNPYWKFVLKHSQEHPTVLDYHTLSQMRYGQFNGWDLSLDLWAFISKRLGITLYEKRAQLAGNMDGNGFELWRALYNEYEGGDEFVKLI